MRKEQIMKELALSIRHRSLRLEATVSLKEFRMQLRTTLSEKLEPILAYLQGEYGDRVPLFEFKRLQQVVRMEIAQRRRQEIIDAAQVAATPSKPPAN